jgi:hypothetical protein
LTSASSVAVSVNRPHMVHQASVGDIASTVRCSRAGVNKARGFFVDLSAFVGSNPFAGFFRTLLPGTTRSEGEVIPDPAILDDLGDKLVTAIIGIAEQ